MTSTTGIHALTLALVLSAPAYAAERTFDWSGSYAGVSGGLVQGTASHPADMAMLFSDPPFDLTDPATHDILDIILPNVFGLCACLDYSTATLEDGIWSLPIPDYLGDAKASFSGAIASAHLGHNWQNGNFVYGLEGDLQAGNLKAQYLSPADAPISLNQRAATSVDWLGTLRGRAGLAHGRMLGYATAGLAIGGVTTTTGEQGDDVGGAPDYSAWSTSSGARLGFVAGGGIEVALTDRLILRGEYLYANLGTKDLPAFSEFDSDSAIGLHLHFRNTVSLHMVKGGISLRF